MRRIRIAAFSLAIVLLASTANAGNNTGGSAQLSWDRSQAVSDLGSLPGHSFPLYILMHGAPDIRKVAFTLDWTPNDLVGPCYYVVSDTAAQGSCGGTAYSPPARTFNGDSSYVYATTVPPGSDGSCAYVMVGAGACDSVAASFCLVSIYTVDSGGAIDTLTVTGGATIFGGSPSGCPLAISAVAPLVLIANQTNTLNITGSGFPVDASVSLVSHSLTLHPRSTSRLASNRILATVDVPPSALGVFDVAVTGTGGQVAVLPQAFGRRTFGGLSFWTARRRFMARWGTVIRSL